MKTRLIAGLSGLAILLPMIIWGGVFAVQWIVIAAVAICVWEYGRMAFPEERQRSGTLWVGLGTYLMLYTGIVAPDRMVMVGALYTVITMAYVTLSPGPDLTTAPDRIGRVLLGVAWISGLGALIVLRQRDDGLIWIFIVLGISWLGDTGAYFAGRAFGSRKLYERVSPNKTVEGMIGGMVASTLGVAVFTSIGVPDATWFDVVVLGVVGCGMGVLGDLSESLLKRAYGVKDAGGIMPGHGGLLDRVDSVLFVAVVCLAWAAYRMP